MTDKINGKTLEEIEAEMDNNMADADVGPLVDRIRDLEGDLSDQECDTGYWKEQANKALAEVARLKQERDEAREKYQWMVNRAADQKLDGYRALGARAAAAEERADKAESEVARLKKGMVGLPRAIVVVPEEEGGYSAEVPSMPGCITCADTWDELLVMITDAQKAWRGEPCEHHDAYVRRAALAGEGVPE